MDPYRGIIIEESLGDIGILKNIPIVSTEVFKVTEKHKTPWLSQWTLHTVEIPGEIAEEIAKNISRAIDSKHPGSWYADFKNSTHHYIIFRNKIFYLDRKDEAQDEEAKQYGLSIGIPERQLDWER